MEPEPIRASALRFVLFLGLVSLLADMTYEGGRSITGPFLGLLGASAATIGVIAGAGELLGYTLRLLSGYISDRTGRYWLLMLVGYTMNVFALPLLATVSHWGGAAGLIIAERIGKALRTPARDVLLSKAGSVLGYGRSFGLHEALDQIGALLGPLAIAAVFSLGGHYRTAFALLFLPAVASLIVLMVTRSFETFPEHQQHNWKKQGIGQPKRLFWLYTAAMALWAAGTADFALIAFHLHRGVPAAWIPLSYGAAMGCDALAALVLGRLYDRRGLWVLPGAVLLSAGAVLLSFVGPLPWALGGVLLWGIGVGAQESLARAALAPMVPLEQRGTAYGLFNASFGIAWFLGSAAMGLLYQASPKWLVTFALLAHGASSILLLAVIRAASLQR